MVPLLLFTWTMRDLAEKAGNADASNPQDVDIPKGAMIAFWVLLPLWIFVFAIGTAACVQATAEIHVNKKPALVPCLAAGLSRTCALVCFSLLLMLGFMVFFLFFAMLFAAVFAIKNEVLVIILAIFIGGCALWVLFYVGIIFQVTPPSVVLEKKSATAAMKTSWGLVKGSRCYVFVVVLTWTLLVFAVNMLGHIFGEVGFLVVSSLWGIFNIPASSILGFCLYTSLRVEKEDFSQSTLLRELGLPELDGQTEMTQDKSTQQGGAHDIV